MGPVQTGKSHCRGESEGGLPPHTHTHIHTDGRFSLGAPCVCWLLFHTISTSLIILISHFYTWTPLFSASDFLFFLSLASGIKAPLPACNRSTHCFHGKDQGSRCLHYPDREKSLCGSGIIQLANFLGLSAIKYAPPRAKRCPAPQVFI